MLQTRLGWAVAWKRGDELLTEMTSWLDSAPKRSGPLKLLQRRLVHRPVTEASRETGSPNGQHRTWTAMMGQR